MHRHNGRQEIDRRTLLAKGAASEVAEVLPGDGAIGPELRERTSLELRLAQSFRRPLRPHGRRRL